MQASRTVKYAALVALALASVLALSAVAGARGNGHRAVKADSDRDWASNKCERQAGLNRYRRDSDRDGRRDGLEDSDGDGANNAAESVKGSNCDVANSRLKLEDAVVISYSADSGLTLDVGYRGRVTAPVSDQLVCEQEIEDAFGEDRTVDCTVADLTPGTQIDEAIIRDGSFRYIELEEVEHDDADLDDDADDADDDADDADDD